MFTMRKIHLKSGTNSSSYVQDYLTASVREEDNRGETKVEAFWFGELAREFGLVGTIRNYDDPWLEGLSSNRNPVTGNRLTSCDREGGTRFYDFQIAPPKSVSIAAMIGDDERILSCHIDAVKHGLSQIQRFVLGATSINSDKNYVSTNNLCAACFTHFSSRTLDPQIHTHCLVSNMTSVENYGLVALQVLSIYNNFPFFGRSYNSKLFEKLSSIGYTMEEKEMREKPGKYVYQILGIDDNILELFSKRSAEINKMSESRKQRGRPPTRKKRDKYSIMTRSKKINISESDLLSYQLSQLTDSQISSVKSLKTDLKSKELKEPDYDLEVEKSFERLLKRSDLPNPLDRYFISGTEIITDILENNICKPINMERVQICISKNKDLIEVSRNIDNPILSSFYLPRSFVEDEIELYKEIFSHKSKSELSIEIGTDIESIRHCICDEISNKTPIIFIFADSKDSKSKAKSVIAEITEEEFVVDYDDNIYEPRKIINKIKRINFKENSVIIISHLSTRLTVPKIILTLGGFNSISINSPEKTIPKSIHKIINKNIGDVVQTYYQLARRGEFITGIAHCQNKEQISELNLSIRNLLRKQDRLGKESNFTFSEECSMSNQFKDLMVVSKWNYSNYSKGQVLKIKSYDEKAGFVRFTNGKKVLMNIFNRFFSVYKKSTIKLSPGDMVAVSNISENTRSEPSVMRVVKVYVSFFEADDSSGNIHRITGENHKVDYGYFIAANSRYSQTSENTIVFEDSNFGRYREYRDVKNLNVILFGEDSFSSIKSFTNLKREIFKREDVDYKDNSNSAFIDLLYAKSFNERLKKKSLRPETFFQDSSRYFQLPKERSHSPSISKQTEIGTQYSSDKQHEISNSFSR